VIEPVKSASGTKRTNSAGLAMSVIRYRPEATGGGRNRRD
jgi:hypothetical protein